jgi:hypothetical protein
MKIQISPDARPQARTLLFATLIALALWFIPYAEILTYPFRIFVTFIHEGGHAIAAILTGNTVASLSVATNGSGETYTTNGNFFAQMFISSAGYIGAILYGALLLFLIRRAVATRIVLVGTAIYILALTFFFGLFNPIWNWSGLSGIPFTLLAGLIIVGALVAVARYANARVASFFVSFLAVQCVLNALTDLKTVLFLSSPWGATVPNDAQNMANATGNMVPAFVWAVLWIVISLVLLSMAMRFYAISKHPPQQPDLPFDEPLDI